jgi:hypothetical protein
MQAVTTAWSDHLYVHLEDTLVREYYITLQNGFRS